MVFLELLAPLKPILVQLLQIKQNHLLIDLFLLLHFLIHLRILCFNQIHSIHFLALEYLILHLQNLQKLQNHLINHLFPLLHLPQNFQNHHLFTQLIYLNLLCLHLQNDLIIQLIFQIFILQNLQNHLLISYLFIIS